MHILTSSGGLLTLTLFCSIIPKLPLQFHFISVILNIVKTAAPMKRYSCFCMVPTGTHRNNRSRYKSSIQAFFFHTLTIPFFFQIVYNRYTGTCEDEKAGQDFDELPDICVMDRTRYF